MPKRYQISEEQVAELEATRKINKDKNVDKRLRALLLHAQGDKRAEVAEKTGFAATYISVLVSKYCNNGIGTVIENNYPGNNRNMSFEEEAALLEPFLADAEAGHVVAIAEILAAYEEKLGHPQRSNSQIYNVLERHGWRKVMPRSKHPNKASDEEIAASKKLT